MPAEIKYDGVRLTRAMPVAWVIAIGLTLAVHAMASVGYSLSNTGMQSMMMVAIFIGVVALVGTAQKLGEMRDTGSRLNSAIATTAFIALSLGSMAYGLISYLP